MNKIKKRGDICNDAIVPSLLFKHLLTGLDDMLHFNSVRNRLKRSFSVPNPTFLFSCKDFEEKLYSYSGQCLQNLFKSDLTFCQ